MSASVKHFQQLEKIKGWRQQAFVLALAERSLPNLLLGLEALDLKSSVDMSRLVSALWHGIIDRADLSFAKPAGELDRLLHQLAERTEYGARPAEDAAQLLALVLGYKEWPDHSLAREAGQLSFQTVTRYIEFTEGETLAEHDLVMLFDRHPLVKRELAFQRELQEILKRAESLDLVLKKMRNAAHNSGVSNIGICLDH